MSVLELDYNLTEKKADSILPFLNFKYLIVN